MPEFDCLTMELNGVARPVSRKPRTASKEKMDFSFRTLLTFVDQQDTDRHSFIPDRIVIVNVPGQFSSIPLKNETPFPSRHPVPQVIFRPDPSVLHIRSPPHISHESCVTNGWTHRRQADVILQNVANAWLYANCCNVKVKPIPVSSRKCNTRPSSQ